MQVFRGRLLGAAAAKAASILASDYEDGSAASNHHQVLLGRPSAAAGQGHQEGSLPVAIKMVTVMVDASSYDSKSFASLKQEVQVGSPPVAHMVSLR